MSQKKTEFRFTVNGDMSVADTIIRNWLLANQFAPKAKPGANYFAFNEPMLRGKRGFEYYFNGNQVLILAYVGTFERPQPLEGFVGAVMKQDYRKDLSTLFEELKKVENGMPTDNATAYQNPAPNANGTYQAPPMPSDSLQTFTEQANKRQETLVIVGFVLSIIGVLISCFGLLYGAIIIAMELYFAIQGLKTSKKGLAIATLVLAGVSVLIFILNIIVYALFA